MTDTYDPTEMLRRGQRLAEIRYQAEVLFRNRISDQDVLAGPPSATVARWAIKTACVFEQEWIIASMSDRDSDDLPLLTTEEDLVAAILEEQEL